MSLSLRCFSCPPPAFVWIMCALLSCASAVAVAQEIDAPAEKIFSGVRGTTSAAQAIVVRNTGTRPLQISSIVAVGAHPAAFTLIDPPATPLTVAAGDSISYRVVFEPGAAVGPLGATLRILSDDADEPVLDVGLHGLSARAKQGNHEPTLNDICITLGYKIDVGGTGLLLGTRPEPIGDEVLQPLFVKAGPGLVTMIPVARYSPDDLLDFGYYTKVGDTVTRTKVATIKLGQEQTLHPQLTTPETPDFDPGTAPFGFYSGPAPRYANHNVYSDDALNVPPSPLRHATRIYPLRDRTGQPLANAYLICMEPAKNGDYQDYVYLVTNVKPAIAGAIDPAPASPPAATTPR